MSVKMKKLVLVVVSLMVCASFAQAISVNLGDSGWAMIINPDVQAVGKVSIPYVFGVVNDSVVIEIDKTFGRWPDEFGIFDPIVVEFEKINENAVSNIVIRDEYIVNNTGYQWHDFHMFLAVSEKREAGFNPQSMPHGGQLEKVYYSNYGLGYNELPTQLNFENTEGDGVNFEPSGLDVFRPGYVSGNISIVTNPDMQVGERFLLKEIPTLVPEPATIALLVFGALPAVLKRKRLA